jgi:hypothetical protein
MFFGCKAFLFFHVIQKSHLFLKDFRQNKGGGGGQKHNIPAPVPMPLIYVIQQARNKLKFLVQPANDMYIYNTSLKFYYNYLKTCKFFTFAIWYGTVG